MIVSKSLRAMGRLATMTALIVSVISNTGCRGRGRIVIAQPPAAGVPVPGQPAPAPVPGTPVVPLGPTGTNTVTVVPGTPQVPGTPIAPVPGQVPTNPLAPPPPLLPGQQPPIAQVPFPPVGPGVTIIRRVKIVTIIRTGTSAWGTPVPGQPAAPAAPGTTSQTFQTVPVVVNGVTQWQWPPEALAAANGQALPAPTQGGTVTINTTAPATPATPQTSTTYAAVPVNVNGVTQWQWPPEAVTAANGQALPAPAQGGTVTITRPAA